MDTYNAPDVKQLTCQACDYTVSQSSGAKRTICPQCGNFYNSGHAENPPEPRRKLRNHKADNRLLSKTHPAPSNSNLANVSMEKERNSYYYQHHHYIMYILSIFYVCTSSCQSVDTPCELINLLIKLS